MASDSRSTMSCASRAAASASRWRPTRIARVQAARDVVERAVARSTATASTASRRASACASACSVALRRDGRLQPPPAARSPHGERARTRRARSCGRPWCGSPTASRRAPRACAPSCSARVVDALNAGRDAARAAARIGRPERSRPARRSRLRHLRRHAPGRQGRHLADQQQLLRHGPRGARAGRRRAPAGGAARSAAALDWEAFAANTSPLHPAVSRARPYPGIVRRSARMRELLAGSYLWEPGAARNLQDPLTFRNAAGILGAVDDGLGFACSQLAIELNAAHENPLVAVGDDELIISVAELRGPAARRGARLRAHRARAGDLERAGALGQAAPGAAHRARHGTAGGRGREQRVRALGARLGQPGAHGRGPLAGAPASRPRPARRCSPRASRTGSRWRRSAPAASASRWPSSEELLALGLVVAAQAVDVRGASPLGSGTARAHAQVRERYAFVAAGDSIGPDRADVVELVRSGALGAGG